MTSLSGAAALCCGNLAATPQAPFLNDEAVGETLIGHTLIGKDWAEYYTADGRIAGKVRYFGIRAYSGKWSSSGGQVCYVYGDPKVDTCSWLRRDADHVSHHRQDGSLKPDGEARRLPGNRLSEF